MKLLPLVLCAAWAGAAAGDDLTRPGPGRVPLQVTAARAQSVAVELAAPDAPPGAIAIGPDAPQPDRAQCVTPCTLYVPPGRLILHTGSAAVRAASQAVEVPDNGLAVRVRSPSRLVRDLGHGLVVAGLGGLLAIVVVHAALDSAGDGLAHAVQASSDSPDSQDRSSPLSRGEGLALAGCAGTALVGAGLILLTRTGVSSHRLARAAGSLRIGVGRAGGTLGAGARF